MFLLCRYDVCYVLNNFFKFFIKVLVGSTQQQNLVDSRVMFSDRFRVITTDFIRKC